MTPGTILIEPGTSLPPDLRLTPMPEAAGWMHLTNRLGPYELEQLLQASGWVFFYMAGTVTATASGFDRPKILATAMRKLVAQVKLRNCNCVEIDEILTTSLLGLTRVSVTVHLRHIKQGVLFTAK
jgi:hypothetical protein